MTIPFCQAEVLGGLLALAASVVLLWASQHIPAHWDAFLSWIATVLGCIGIVLGVLSLCLGTLGWCDASLQETIRQAQSTNHLP